MRSICFKICVLQDLDAVLLKFCSKQQIEKSFCRFDMCKSRLKLFLLLMLIVFKQYMNINNVQFNSLAFILSFIRTLTKPIFYLNLSNSTKKFNRFSAVLNMHYSLEITMLSIKTVNTRCRNSNANNKYNSLTKAISKSKVKRLY